MKVWEYSGNTNDVFYKRSYGIEHLVVVSFRHQEHESMLHNEMQEAMSLFGRHATVDEKQGNKEAAGAALVSQIMVRLLPFDALVLWLTFVCVLSACSCFGVGCFSWIFSRKRTRWSTGCAAITAPRASCIRCT